MRTELETGPWLAHLLKSSEERSVRRSCLDSGGKTATTRTNAKHRGPALGLFFGLRNEVGKQTGV